MSVLGERIKKLRGEESLRSLSARTSISTSFLSDIERGRTNPSKGGGWELSPESVEIRRKAMEQKKEGALKAPSPHFCLLSRHQLNYF